VKANRIRGYLDARNGVRIAVLCAGFIIASVGAYLGVGVYALTTGPKATGNYMADRIMAVCFLGAIITLNFGLAWVLGIRRPTSGFFPRLVASASITVCGTIPVFVIIVGRAILWHSFEH
jgi:hypothetical protein